MEKNYFIQTETITDHEEDQYYGPKTKETGEAYKMVTGGCEHLYLQRDNNVLHLNPKGQIVNVLHRGFLNRQIGLIKITAKEFNDELRKFIYDNELDKYWGS